MFAPAFLQALQSTAIALPETVLAEVVKWLPQTVALDPEQWQYQLLHIVPSPPVRRQIVDLIEHWQRDYPTLPPTAIALALQSTAATVRNLRAETPCQPVWTIPRRSGDWVRQTEPTILELIEQTQQDLLIISFAVYDVPQIVQALSAAIQRNVTIRMVVEMPEASEKIPFGVVQAFPARLLEQIELYYWPKYQRPTDRQGNHGSLHIKAIVSDQNTVLISSANLTQYALALNMELGLIAHQPPLAVQITKTINALIDAKILITL